MRKVNSLILTCSLGTRDRHKANAKTQEIGGDLNFKMEVDYDEEPVVIKNSSAAGAQSEMFTLPIEEIHQEENDCLPCLSRSAVTHNQHANFKTEGNITEEMEYEFPHKRRRTAPMTSNNLMSIQDQDYDDDPNIIYDYEAAYDAASVTSEGSYLGDQPSILTEVLSYCQAMYDMVQKLDKKMDSIQRKVTELHYDRVKPHFKPRPGSFPKRSSHALPQGKLMLQKINPRFSSSHILPTSQDSLSLSERIKENNQQRQTHVLRRPVSSVSLSRVQRQSPPLPTIISTRSLQHSVSVTDAKMAECKPSQTAVETFPNCNSISAPNVSAVSTSEPVRLSTPETTIQENCPNTTLDVTSQKIIVSDEILSSTVSTDLDYAYLGDPSRNVKIPGTSLMKAKQKTKPVYAARYLFHVLFSKNSSVENEAPSMKTLDSNQVSAIREFLESSFPAYDLSESGKEWKKCANIIKNMFTFQAITNTMAKINHNQSHSQIHETLICVDSDHSEDEKVKSPWQTASSETAAPVIQQKDNQNRSEHHFLRSTGQNESVPHLLTSTGTQPSTDTIDYFGEKSRNVKLSTMIMFKGKEKSRPELAARFLIKQIFPDDVLVISNVYGSPDRGVPPLDPNKIGALRDFLQENYPTFDLKESGQDWKACVAAINSSIRSLRHERKNNQGRKKT
uniref:BEN domain-containing protein n=3 Tax=Xenopus tropicalis TaxID=8364 RepID=A0A803JCZ6_XENTR